MSRRIQEFKPFNVESSTWENYRALIQYLREQLGVRFSHYRPALAVQQNPPTQFFDLVLETNTHAVRFRFRSDNLYLLGYRMVNGQWLEFDPDPHNDDDNDDDERNRNNQRNRHNQRNQNNQKNRNNQRNQNNQLVHLITEPGTNFLGFNGSYGGLERVAHQSTEQMRVGFHNLVYAINQLAETIEWEARARSLVVVIMMICESARLIPVSRYMADNFDNRPGTSRDTEGLIEPWIMRLVRKWRPMSAALLRADAYPGQRFQFRQDNNLQVPPEYGGVVIRTIQEAAEILGILLGLWFTPTGEKRRSKRAVPREEQCDQGFIGVPLVEVFSLRINSIDNEHTGKLHGTITIDNGLYTEYIYNCTRGKYESVRPGQNITLTGPSESVSAFGDIIIKVLLTDNDKIPWDDRVVNQDISWDAADIGAVYDNLISRQIGSIIGSVTVNYAVLRNAVAATVTVTLNEGGKETTGVYGHVSACYGKWEDPEATCLLFNRPSKKNYVKVNRWETIPLLRSVVAVPMNDTLKVTVGLHDHDLISNNDEIANGTVEFPVLETIPAPSFKDIYRRDRSNWVRVTINWSSGF